MCKHLDSIKAEAAAADRLTRACKANVALEASVAPPQDGLTAALRKSFQTSCVTPNDMVAQLRRMK